jgi:hypothetical protein
MLLSALLLFGIGAGDAPWKLPPLREQAEIEEQWVKKRLDTVLPALMRKHGIQMWLVDCREYNEDPVFFSLVAPTTFAARRRTIYVFFDRGPDKGVERLALGGDSQDGLYTVYRDPVNKGKELFLEQQWLTLDRVIEQRQPRNIAVNISHTHAFSDGLSAGEREQLEQALGPKWMKRVVHSGRLPLEYIDERLPEMLPVYRGMMEDVHWLIGRAFSSEVITPGKTTNLDVVWWLRQQTVDMGFGTWFHPTVKVQRQTGVGVDLLDEEVPVVIERGDVLHVDFGVTGMRLATDTQHMGYVLREGETDAPAGIQNVLQQGKRLQEIVLERLKPGSTGNEALTSALAAMKAEGIRGSVYSHSIGDHGHGAGPIIGLWDHQEGVPGMGDAKVIPNSWFSVELSVRAPVPEWGGKELFIGMEEDASVDAAGRAGWVLRRQERFHLIR